MILYIIYLSIFAPVIEPVYYHEAVEPDKITVNVEPVMRRIKY